MSILGSFRGDPWQYQEEDSALAVKEGGLMFGYETGLGKTFTSLHAAHNMGGNRILITGTQSSLSVWLTEVPKWTEGKPTYLSAKNPQVDDEWRKALDKGRPGIWLLNHRMFEILMARHKTSKKPKWDILIEDEAHKSKNRKTLLFKALKAAEFDNRMLLSATFASRGAQDIWAPLNQLDPAEFSSFWRFVSTFCFVDRGPYGNSIEGTRNKDRLRELLKKYYVKRRFKDVHQQMPPLRRQVVMLEMDQEQTRLYNRLKDDFMLEGPESFTITSGVLAQSVRLRQLALCPKVLDPTFPLGAAVDYLKEDIPETDQHTVIFSISKQILEIVKQELTSQGVKCFMLSGGMSPPDVAEEIRRFKESGGTMLCTIAFAQSFALDTVSRAYVIGLDADPIQNIQAEGRLRRADSKLGAEGVLVRYLIIQGTREEDFKDIVNVKMANVGKFMPI